MADNPTPDDETGPHQSSRINWSELWASEEADDWLVDPLIARGRAHSLYAPGKAGKSLLALWVAASAATGRPVLNRPASDPVRTLYVDLEMTRADVRDRLTDAGFGAADDLDALAYFSLPPLAALDGPSGGAELAAMAVAHGAELVVVDTLARALAGEENSADTLRHFARHTISALKAIGDEGVALLRIDHAGKDLDRGQRGTSAKVDDVDVVWRLQPRDRSAFDLRCTHRRMNWVPELVRLQRHEHPLHYTVVEDSWPTGTRAAADILDRLEVPVDYGRTRARKVLTEAGEAVSNETLSAALRWRQKGRP